MEIIASDCDDRARNKDSALAKDARQLEDLDAFLAAVEHRALRIAELATRDRDEALDVVQDAMLQLARRYAKRPAAEWPPLFYRILNNKVRDWQRRQTVRRRLFLAPAGGADDEQPSLAERIADPAQRDAAQHLGQREAMVVLSGAIRALPERQRQAFVLRVWEGLSVEETAQVMACSDGSVKTHLSRALAALRARLEGVWP